MSNKAMDKDYLLRQLHLFEDDILAQKAIASEEGFHNFRFYNEKFSYKNGNTWEDINYVIPLTQAQYDQLSTAEKNKDVFYWITDGTPSGGYIEDKADKVVNATNGHFAGLDTYGNLTDSGKKASDFLTSIPIASSDELGGMKPDGTTIEVDPITGVASVVGGAGHDMTPTPSASLNRASLQTAIAAAVTEGGINDDVVSAWAAGNWSNTMTYRVVYSGTIAVGDTGIGEWITGADLETLRAETDLTTREAAETTGTGGYGWWKDSHFIIPSGYDYDIKFKFEPHENGEVVTLGGYILDDETGCLCIKFGGAIVNTGTKIAVDIIVTQNNISSSGGV